jgi:hypothetical protein
MVLNNSELNSRFFQDEEFILEAVDRALTSKSGVSSVGFNGEMPLYDFFSRYLPPVVTVAMGRIGFSNCQVSHPIDILILDSRYPILSYYPDGLVIAPLHGVLATFAVTPVLTSQNVANMMDNIVYAASLADQLLDEDGLIKSYGFVYRSIMKINEIEPIFPTQKINRSKPNICILRLPREDNEDVSEAGFASGLISYNPLNILFSDLIHDIFSLLSIRNYGEDGLCSRLSSYKDWPSLSDGDPTQNVAQLGNSAEDEEFVLQ